MAMDGTIIRVNQNYLQMLGYSESEMLGKHISAFADPNQTGSSDSNALWEKLRRGEPVSGDYKRIGKGGKEVWIHGSYNPIPDLNGKLHKIVAYVDDITAEKLKSADFEGQMAAISKVEGIIEFNLEGKVTRVNENFAKVTGYTQEEIVGKHHSMFIDAAYKASPEYKEFWNKLGRGEADVGQYKRIGKGGKEIWLQASYNPIFDLNGKAFKVVKYATDVTDVVMAQQALVLAVAETQEVVAAAKAGDLTQRISTSDKTGEIANLCGGVNDLIESMAEIITQIKEASDTINTAAGEISAGNNDLSQRTEEQASSLEETASSMEELASTVKQNAENAKQANQLAASASGVAVKGG
ncbi:MAG: PAS domain S-box protein, partial [Nitrosomonadales bacterium]|nr:PAS domain S-box protein [Nitrosomonadales bacterium]